MEHEMSRKAPTSWGPPAEALGRTLGVGLALLIGAVAAGAATGVLDAFDTRERMALATFGAIFAVAAYRLDAALGNYVRGLRHLGAAAAVFDVATAIGIFTPYGAILLAAIPLAAASHLALYDRGRLVPATRPVTPTAAKEIGRAHV